MILTRPPQIMPMSEASSAVRVKSLNRVRRVLEDFSSQFQLVDLQNPPSNGPQDGTVGTHQHPRSHRPRRRPRPVQNACRHQAFPPRQEGCNLLVQIHLRNFVRIPFVDSTAGVHPPQIYYCPLAGSPGGHCCFFRRGNIDPERLFPHGITHNRDGAQRLLDILDEPPQA